MKVKFKAAVLSLLMALGGNSGAVATAATGQPGNGARSSYVAKNKKSSAKFHSGKKRVSQKKPAPKSAQKTVGDDKDSFSNGVPSRRPAGMRRRALYLKGKDRPDTIPAESLKFILEQDEKRQL